MAILNTDIKYRLSGGAGNSNVNASLGGIKSSTEITDNTLHNAFDIVSGQDAQDGDTEYRCFYVHNAHGSLTLYSAKVFISQASTGTGDELDIGVGSSAVNDTEQTVADENTAPTTVTFSRPTTYATGLALGDIPAGQHKAFWERRTVNTGAAAATPSEVRVKAQGESDA